jgi:hypothetical protein
MLLIVTSFDVTNILLILSPAIGSLLDPSQRICDVLVCQKKSNGGGCPHAQNFAPHFDINTGNG